MNDTKNDLESNIELLERVLSGKGTPENIQDTYDIYMKDHNFDPIKEVVAGSNEGFFLAGVLHGLRIALDILEANE